MCHRLTSVTRLIKLRTGDDLSLIRIKTIVLILYFCRHYGTDTRV